MRLTCEGPAGPLPDDPGSGICRIDSTSLLAHIDGNVNGGHLDLSDAARERVAARFRALGEPTRLRVLERLFRGPASVSEVLEHVGGTQANVSKHLSLLYAEGLVSRRKEGTRTVYAISDPTLKKICSLVCTEVERQAQTTAAAVLGTARKRR